MLKRIALFLFSAIVIASIVFPLASCSTGATQTITSNPVVELTGRVSNLETNVAAVKAKVDSLPATTDFSPRIAALESSVTTIAGQISVLQSGQSPTLAADVAALEASLANMQSGLTLLQSDFNSNSAAIVTTQSDISQLKITLADVQSQLDELGNSGNTELLERLETVESELDELQSQLATLNTAQTSLKASVDALTLKVTQITTDLTAFDAWWQLQQGKNSATITNLGNNYLILQADNAGEFAIILTIYGSSLSTGIVNVPTTPDYKADVFDEYLLGSNILVVMICPTSVSGNWTARQSVRVNLGSLATNISYIEISTGAVE